MSTVIKQSTVKIRVVYADDEVPAREKISHQLSLIPNVDVVGFATTGKEAIALINNERPDVVLLDIQMPEINGLELLDLLDYKPLIIFTTAYDNFAIQAFEQSSTDYLLKPFPLSRLIAALDKAKAAILMQRNNIDSVENSENKIAASYTLNQYVGVKRLNSKNGESIKTLSPSELFFIKAEQGNSLAWDGENHHCLSETLDQLEQAFESSQLLN